MQSTQSMELCLLMRDLWKKDQLTLVHSYRVTQIAVSFANFLTLSQYEVKLIELGGLLHDIGKINISNPILNKNSKLSDIEFAEIKKHPIYGYNILLSYPLGEEVNKMALYHHERWDGKGYPYGLSKENIPFLTRILTLADTLEAITGIRPYRSSQTWEEASTEIAKSKGTQFDPYLANEFLQWMTNNEFPIETNSSQIYQKVLAI